MLCEEKVFVDKAMEIDGSLVHSTPNVELEDKNKGKDEEDVEKKHAKSEPLKVNPLFEDFSYLNDDSTSMFELLDMTRVGAFDTFKLAKWTLQEFNKVNIKIRGLKESLNILKGLASNILINRIVDLEGSFHDFKSLCEERLASLEAKILDTNADIKNLLHACHISVKNSADSLEALFHKISELREDQLYFSKLMEKDHSAKGKGKKGAKYYGKGPVVRGSIDWKKSFEAKKKEFVGHD